jgi:signal transduction histidine kinase
VYGDSVQLHQVVVNLCVNALQAMEPGGKVTVRTQSAADSVMLTVEDTGSGISPEIAERVFEPFFTTKDAARGTGLGLSVVQGIVTAHGGTITFQSQPGQGTHFVVRLPTEGERESDIHV